jgi:hypothetical protein
MPNRCACAGKTCNHPRRSPRGSPQLLTSSTAFPGSRRQQIRFFAGAIAVSVTSSNAPPTRLANPSPYNPDRNAAKLSCGVIFLRNPGIDIAPVCGSSR